jgi:hypothetical protein
MGQRLGNPRGRGIAWTKGTFPLANSSPYQAQRNCSPQPGAALGKRIEIFIGTVTCHPTELWEALGKASVRRERLLYNEPNPDGSCQRIGLEKADRLLK